MKEILSRQNEIIKETVKLHQKKYRNDFILVEGKKAVQEAISAGLKIKYIFSLEECEGRFECFKVNKAVMEKISTTDTPPNIAAVIYKPVYKLEEFKKFKKIVLLDNIKDAGNLGTIIRTSCAFGADGILLFGDTTDEFSPKTIRSAAGNIFKIPILKINLSNLSEFKKTHKFVSTVVNSKNYLENFIPPEKYIVMFGSEAFGLCKELLNISDETIAIKMKNSVESLNLALSCGIILYELQK